MDSLLATHLRDSRSEVVGSGMCLLVLSHGQAGVERDVNSISRKDRWLHYTLFMTTFKHIGGVLNIEIDQEVRNADFTSINSLTGTLEAYLKTDDHSIIFRGMFWLPA